jgi:hypothetical protein
MDFKRPSVYFHISDLGHLCTYVSITSATTEPLA